jgi:hypothetical protein
VPDDDQANTAEAHAVARPEVTDDLEVTDDGEPDWPQLPAFELEVAVATPPIRTPANARRTA